MASTGRASFVFLCCFVILSSSFCTASKLKYTEAFSKVPWQDFPGGRYKASTNATLTATTIAGALTEIYPGGVRELHWHVPDEWAIVLKGACMATVTDEGKLHPSDTWNFTVGDVWYFPANVPHSIIGLEPDGCQFVSGYASPDFDELNAFGASSWLASLTVETLAQGLGVSMDTARQISGATKRASPTFLPMGDYEQLVTQAPSLPLQWPKLIHRFPLMQNTYAVTNNDGSYINKVDVSLFPISKDMAGAVVRIAPGGMRQLHWHLNFDEWQYVVDGELEAGVFLAPGESEIGVIGAGDLGFAPKGSGHYLKNIGTSWAHCVLIFNSGEFTDVEISNFLGTFPPSWVAASLDISTEMAEQINYSLPGFAPAQDSRGGMGGQGNYKPQ